MKSEGRKVGSFRFDIEAAEEELKEIHAQKVMLQLPEGLKLKAEEFMDLFEEDMMIWGGSCYGACDLPEDIGQADALLHIGHSEIPNLKTDYPIVYLEGRSTRWEKLPEDLYEQIEGKVALYGPVQHLHHLEKAAEELEERGIEPVIGEGD
ncbi:MAG: diphthamide synthesis protein, partial [Candidatus Thermoplasmatota archaeon]|nr:diphthamide synthesis protein [Candidatus Thermoplasmatota archaeon]